MLVSTTTMIGIQCAKCGEVQFNSLSVFDFSHFYKELCCASCGAILINITSIKHKEYGIEYPCIYCGDSHSVLLSRELLWGEELIQLSCKEKELPVGYIGPQTEVISCCQEIKRTFIKLASELVRDEELESEFDNFYVVYAVMEKLGKMVEQGLLGCRCGNNSLSVEILSDRIKIICGFCQAKVIIYTDNKEILRILDGVGSLFLEESTKWFIDNSYKDHDLVKNK